MGEKELFMDVFWHFQNIYPDSKLRMEGTYVFVKDKLVFNIDGYNLLYNLQRLCDALKPELL